MRKKNLNFLIVGFESSFNLKGDYFLNELLNGLNKRYKIKIYFSEKEIIKKGENIDFILFSIYTFKYIFFKKYKKIPKLLYSGENIENFNFNIFFIFKILFDKFNINYKYLNPIINLKFLYFPFYNFFHIKYYLKNLDSNNFALIQNKNIKSKYCYSVPFFISLLKKDNNKYFNLLLNRKFYDNKSKKFCVFVVSNPNNYQRNIFFKKLNHYKKIDSYGKLFRNKSFYKSKNWFEENIKLYSKYKFTIAFENSKSENYITEKIILPFLGGSIPIYSGAGDIYDFFNKGSFINIDDYKDFDKAVKEIRKIDSNEKLYLKMLNTNIFSKRNIENINKYEKNYFTFLNKILNRLK